MGTAAVTLALGSVLWYAPPAFADCTASTVGSATTVTCTGNNITDANGGISYENEPVDILDVNGILANIEPDAGIDGVSLTGNGGNGGNGNSEIGTGHDGDPGGDGKSVEINFDGTPFSIITGGASNGQGIVATAKGGKGGEGGTGEDDVIDPFATKGGKGGKGGNGGDVTVNSDGTIATDGQYAHGILAVSEAGDGGKGGHAEGAIDSEGGEGGQGGTAGDVFVDNDASITTSGSQALGIYAQSIGGSGGDGGSADGIFGGGGSGEGPGPAGTVTVTNTGAIATVNDDSTGIMAQSVGGFAGNGGGDGGLFAYGGGAQSFGDAGEKVIVTNSAQITTQGTAATAILAQSIGGGGGNAGTSVGLVALGGSGSAGGDGGVVEVTNSAVLTTSQDYSDGLFAQSVGGGGGNAGTSVGLVSIGGNGGSGGSGSTVIAYNRASISTGGDHANAILVQSVGKGGGKGGGAVAVGAEVSVAVGGKGGSGGDGGEVFLNQDVEENSTATTISTVGDHSVAVMAQSVGGGGGKGGWAVSASAGYIGDISVGVGGGGGDGGNSEMVTLHNNGAVTTQGNHSSGIVAQSTAGGGGVGGFDVTVALSTDASFGVGVGGGGGGAGNSGAVELASWTDVTTIGDHSSGVFAQSAGGSGGHGGFSIVATGSAGINVGVSVGGGGGDGGAAESVMLSSTGDVTTSGDHASAVFGQSSGGSGGNGGFSISASAATGMTIPVSVGGGGGTGGEAGAVTVNSAGTLMTTGISSHGLFAQSSGGGGGNGGFSVSGGISGAVNIPVSVGGGSGSGGFGAAVVANSNGDITTVGNSAHAIFAQSSGGSGGNGGFSIAGGVAIAPEDGGANFGVSVGGGGGTGNTASTVMVDSAGDLETSGNNAAAIFAQSKGGGGGNGGFSIEGSVTIGGEDGGTNIDVSVGGSAGDGNFASAVTVTSDGNVTTHGENSAAIFAESVGGGGGNGGFSITGGVVIGASGGNIGVSVGGEGGSASVGGDVSVTTTGDLTTSGNNSPGVLAQSVGGSGGNGGFSATFGGGPQAEIGVSVGGKAKSGGDGAKATLTSAGTVMTAGNLSYGLQAQSVGGSGGNGGFSIAGSLSIDSDGSTANVSVSVGGGGGDGGNGGVVDLTNTGSVFTEGEGAHAVFAQSVGKGGGAGGFSGSADISFSQGGANIGVSVGGGGGTGGSGGNVTVYSSGAQVDVPGGTISTRGDGATGIMAQSVGGSGGDGGFSFAANLGVDTGGDGQEANIGVSVGGGGGDGGTAGMVDVTNYNNIFIGTLETDTVENKTVITGITGTSGSGIFAQSVGGSGGNGGLSVSGALNLSKDTPSNNLNVAVGGDGGTGNHANTVSVENHGDIATLGGKSNAIFAQSVGGNGGNGGLSFAGSLAGSLNQGGSKDIDISVGGSGGGGGHGSAVTVTNTGALTTGTVFEFEPIAGLPDTSDVPVLLQGSPIPGYQAQGIFAQSVGGGGGTGGLAGSAVLSNSGGGTNLNVNVSVGGSGGTASNGGMVGVTNSGAIVTYAVASTGIVAQSVGGGGGAGGSSFTGIVGVNRTSDPQNAEARKLNVNVAIGGSGGGGGTGGDVTVHNMAGGDITTFGGSAKGIAAQSIGGGGGSGGAADAFSLQIGKCTDPLIPGCSAPDSAEKALNLNVAVGGSGGNGGDANAVMVENFGFIQTAGASSEAIYAQSIGGGGGEGGNGAIGLKSLIGIPGAVIDDIVDIVDPPVQFWTEVAVNVGGAGGTAGNGGTITIENNNILITTGDQSSAIYAQSGGGGGGQGGKSNGGALNVLGVHVGGASGAAGDGDTVEVTNTSDIGTTGVSSVGIFAQSFGGGGGDGGAVNPDFLGTGWAFGLGVNVSQGGGHGGNGGEVTVTNSAVIVTEGEGAHGIWAQSVGGGGGLAGASGASLLGLSFAGSNGDEGNAGDVIVNHTGDILTLGDGAAGIFAQSASGGEDGSSSGGVLDAYALGATGDGGTVTINVNSTIITEGEKSRAIVAQSIGKEGNGDITVTIGTGSVIIGGTDMDGFGVDDDPVGIQLLDGKTNLIDIAGLVTTREGFSGTAIATSVTSNDMTTNNDTFISNTVNNTGIVTGSMFLRGVTNAINNKITGLLNMGVTIDLGGSPNTLTNKGVVSPGGVNQLLTTGIVGDYVQDSTGSYVVTVNYADNNPAAEVYDGPGTGDDASESDLINVTGSVDLDGFVIVDALHGAFVGPDKSGSVLILTSDGGFSNPTLEAHDTEVVTYTITYDDTSSGNKVYLNWDVDFTPSGLNRNETSVADYIIATIADPDNPPEAMDPIINSLLEAPDLDSLRNDYDRLTPEPYIDNEIVTVLSNMDLGRSLVDCPRPKEYQDRDKGCFWLRGGAHQAEQSESFEYLGFDEFAYEAEGGIGGNISDTAGVVLGFSYSNSRLDTKGRSGTPDIATSTGYRYQGGIGFSNTLNGTSFALAALGGAAFYDVERNVELTDFSGTAEGKQNLYFGGGQLRLAHEARAGEFRFAPLFEAWGGYFYQDAISESGAAGANLDIDSKEDYFLAVRPALTLALELTSDGGSVFRPFISGGATYFALGNDGDGPSLTATLQGDENMVPGFAVSSALQDYYIDAMAGFYFEAPNGATLRLSGSAQYAEDYLSYGGTAKFVAPF